MNIILIPVGSAGDVHPFIGLGREFKKRGHRVTVLTNDYFKVLTEGAGLEFAASSSADDFKGALEDPRLWDPNKGFEFVTQHSSLPLLSPVYEYLKKNYEPGNTLAVGSTLAWGARIAQEKLGLPFVMVHLQPAIFMSLHDTPVYGQAPWLSRGPKFIKKAYLFAGDAVTDKVVVPELNKFRATLGLSPVKHILRDWVHSPLLTLGLFPDWFAPPQVDWPKHVKLTNFPLYDAGSVHKISNEVQSFLDSGTPPVVFTAGSAMKQAGHLFKVSVEACEKLGSRGLLINAFEDQIPAYLPENVMATRYAPFSEVFGRASVVVHHGGVGTTAQSFAAGVPQLVTPFAHDQFDNAARVKRLGAGLSLSPKKYTLDNVTTALRSLMNDQKFRLRAQALSTRLNGAEAIARTCDIILNNNVI